MEATINSKRYDTDKCEKLGSLDHYSPGANNYAGETCLMRASNGVLLACTVGNGQTCHVVDNLRLWDPDYDSVDKYYHTEAQLARCVGLGLIEIVEKEGRTK